MHRRDFLQVSSVGLTLGLPVSAFAQDDAWPTFAPDTHVAGAVRLQAIEPVEIDGKLWIRTLAEDGSVGVVADNGRLLDCLSLFQRRTVPAFLGQDARDLDRLLDEAYVRESNYKYAGMPFWVCVAFVELSVLDLLGRVVGKPVGALFGNVLRDQIPVYLTRLTRETTPEEEVSILEEQLAQTGAKAVKVKIGGRMKNTPADVKRTNGLVPLARKQLGDAIRINVDANGSYTVAEAIEVGRMLEANNVGFYEEPCPWEEHAATKEVADALEVTVAGGEQDSSEAAFRWMIANGGFDLVQPDVYYNGGIIRTLRIARLAAEKGIAITPHSPKTGAPAAPMLHFASLAPNLGPFQEYIASPEIKDGKVAVPAGPGLGFEFDDRTCRDAKPIE